MIYDASRSGRIITFYSYKGGTGRSMAVANIAFILASRGMRVLVIDWDLEAPGLHRYFHPFLEDPEIAHAPGLIDFFTDFAAAAVGEAKSPKERSQDDDPWWATWSSLLRYTCRLSFDGAGNRSSGVPLDGGGEESFGPIDFVSAGRQDADYAAKVHGFDWGGFYTRLGGGVLLEAVKKRLRERYDYVLVDSRTGISDTSGICTVQMPDELVVCCTLNAQSMSGAAAVAASVSAQRVTPSGAPGVRVWPVPMRVELAERDRLEAARDAVRVLFARHVSHLKRSQRAEYWGRVETLYHPFFAYEEVLAVFAEQRHRSSSLLASYEFLTACLTDGEIDSMSAISESLRRSTLARFSRKRRDHEVSPSPRGPVFIYVSYRRGIENVRDALSAVLQDSGMQVWSDAQVAPGEVFMSASERALESADMMVALIPRSGVRAGMRRELEEFQRRKKPIIPVLIGVGYDALPSLLKGVKALRLGFEPTNDEFALVLDAIRRLSTRTGAILEFVDPEDPQKGQWGGQSERNGRRLSARVTSITDDWFAIRLMVSSTGAMPLSGTVTFHLHPTFPRDRVEVPVMHGAALLDLEAFGAFTVGVETDGGRTSLELDLALDRDFPTTFRER